MQHQDDKQLKECLGRWKASEPLPPRFADGVWRRIERAAATPRAWDIIQNWLESAFVRKPVALAYVTVLLLAGLAAGLINGHARQQRVNSVLAARYVQSLDPDQRTMP